MSRIGGGTLGRSDHLRGRVLLMLGALSSPVLAAKPASPNAALAAKPASPNAALAAESTSPNAALAAKPASPNAALAAKPASPADEVRAAKLFDDALRLMLSDHCQDAVPLFLESERLASAAATLANLATCYVRLGKTGSAYETYRAAARAAILESKPALQAKTDNAAAELAPTLTRLRVIPVGTGSLPEIRINGQLMDDVRKPMSLDPGENLIEASAPGSPPWRRTVNAQGDGSLLVVEVPDLSARRDEHERTPAVPRDQALATASAPQKNVNLLPYAVAAAGIGVAATAMGTAYAFSATSKYDESNAYCDGPRCTDPGIDRRDRAQDRAEVATWAFGVGLTSLGAAGVLWFLSTRHEQPPRAAHVSPWMTLSPQSVGLGFGGKL